MEPKAVEIICYLRSSDAELPGDFVMLRDEDRICIREVVEVIQEGEASE